MTLLTLLRSPVGGGTATGRIYFLQIEKSVLGAGAFTLTGNDASLLRGLRLTAGTGEFTLTGNDITFDYVQSNRTLSASPGSFTLTGVPAGLLRGRVLHADTGAFTLDGKDISMFIPTLGNIYHLQVVTPKSLVAAKGTFTLTGVPANHRYNTLIAAGNIYHLQVVAQTANRVLQCAPGSFTWTGADAERDLVLPASAGTFALTPKTIEFLIGLEHSITALPGAFTLAGIPIGFIYNRVLTAGTGAFTLTGNPIEFRTAQYSSGVRVYTVAPVDRDIEIYPTPRHLQVPFALRHDVYRTQQ